MCKTINASVHCVQIEIETFTAFGQPIALLCQAGKLCRLIFAEDIPWEEVDEKFLDLIQRAENYNGTHAPSRPAPALCLVTPPFQVDRQLAGALDGLLRGHGHNGPARGCSFPELHKENLTSAWYASTASKAKAWLFGLARHKTLHLVLLKKLHGVRST